MQSYKKYPTLRKKRKKNLFFRAFFTENGMRRVYSKEKIALTTFDFTIIRRIRGTDNVPQFVNL